MGKWTKEDIKRLNLVTDLEENVKKKPPCGIKIPKIEKISVEKETIKKVLWVMHREGSIPDYVEEHQFHEVRKYRFDWAIPELMIAIEYEGIFSKKSGHTTITGYTKDCEKYNLATMKGWKILRYTAKNYKNFPNDLKKMLMK